MLSFSSSIWEFSGSIPHEQSPLVAWLKLCINFAAAGRKNNEMGGVQHTSRCFNNSCHNHTRVLLQDEIKRRHQIIPDLKVIFIHEEFLNYKMFSNAATSFIQTGFREREKKNVLDCVLTFSENPKAFKG